MSDQQQSNFDRLDVVTLTNLLVNPDQDSETHRMALSALSRVNPSERRSRVIIVMRNLLRMPERFDQDVMTSLVDLLATDPDPDATLAMLDILREMLAAVMTNRTALKPSFREYFYEALVTRQREGDLTVWAEMLPTLDSRTLVAALLDPVAGALQALEPVTLIDRQPEPGRTKALLSAVAGLVQRDGDPEQIKNALAKLSESADPDQVEQSIELFAERWEKATHSGDRRQAALLREVLATLDPRPRTGAERLMGKRPWAP